MPDQTSEISEEELRKCPICNGILDYCDSKDKKSFCRDLLMKLKEGKISSNEFSKKFNKKIDIDKLLKYMEKKEKKKV